MDLTICYAGGNKVGCFTLQMQRNIYEQIDGALVFVSERVKNSAKVILANFQSSVYRGKFDYLLVIEKRADGRKTVIHGQIDIGGLGNPTDVIGKEIADNISANI